jgi:hypothetical protein
MRKRQNCIIDNVVKVLHVIADPYNKMNAGTTGNVCVKKGICQDTSGQLSL